MQYGHFDDTNREYVIDRPDTPTSWTNYLGKREYGGVITNNAGGFTFDRTAGAGRINRSPFNAVPLDQPGRYFYLRDAESGDYWSASWQPVNKSLDDYTSVCRFGMGYANISSDYSNIKTETTYVIPMDEKCEIWRLRVTNTGDTPRKIQVFNFTELTSEWHIFMDAFNLQYSMYTVQTKWQNGFVQHSTNPYLAEDLENFKNRDQSRWVWATMLGADVVGYDLDRDKFLGSAYRSYANPLVIEEGTSRNSEAYGDNGCASMQTVLELAPGETREISVLIGTGKVERDGKPYAEKYSDPAAIEKALQGVKNYWHNLLDCLQVETPDDDFNHMINVWNNYNALITFFWARSASMIYSGDERDGFGFRDSVQDIPGSVHAVPEKAGKHLALMLTAQESLGGAMPELKPYAHEPGKMPLTPKHEQRSDDMLWMFNSIPLYVAETGDMDFYKKVIPYSDQGEDTVFVHLKKAILFNLERTGKNGLPIGLHADWDDCIRMGFNGETVFVAMQVCYGLRVLENVANHFGWSDDAAWAVSEREKMEEKLQRLCWDGEWFIRGINERGEILGTHKSPDEAMIFFPIQSWSVLSGVATEEQGRKAVDSVEKHLATDYGCMAIMPPVTTKPCEELRMVLLNAGQKENAGVFNHSQGWIVMANCMLGNGDQAWKRFSSFMPARFNDKAEMRVIEPYVHGQSTDSVYSPNYGRAHIPWLSGTASWSMYSATSYILGIRAELDGLRIDPCISSEWPEFKVTRIFRGKKVNITVSNPKGLCSGVHTLTINGKTIDGNLIPLDILTDETTVSCEITG